MAQVYYCVVSQGDPVKPSTRAVKARGLHTRVAAGSKFSDAVKAATIRSVANAAVFCLQEKVWTSVAGLDPNHICEEGDTFYFKVETPLASVVAGLAFQLFAQTVGNPQMTPCNKFWKISGDPSANFDEDFLIWIRQVYGEMEKQIKQDMLLGYGTFIVLGTAGTGKSIFALYFILKEAMSSQKPLLFKKGEEVYVIDGFNRCAMGPYEMSSPQIQQLRFDRDVWLVIDGKQEGQLVCHCKVLQVCSTKKENFEEAGKVGKAQKLYMPVWSEDEVEQFMVDYEPYRAHYEKTGSDNKSRGGMWVPTLEEVRAQFKVVGGVARYLLQKRKLADGRKKLATAIRGIPQDGEIMSNVYKSDCLLHFIPASNLTEINMDFASAHVWEELQKAYNQQEVVEIARFLEKTVDSSSLGTVWGKVYELLVHRRLSEGGEFQFKQVTKAGVVIAEENMTLTPRTWKVAKDIEELKSFVAADLYCTPKSKTFQSVDGALKRESGTIALPQAFRRADGKHGYEVQGLEIIHQAFQAPRYELWACVPVELYEKTGYREFVNNKREFLKRMKQIVVQVDYRFKSNKVLANRRPGDEKPAKKPKLHS